MSGWLFSKRRLSEFLDSQEKELSESIRSMDKDSILNHTDTVAKELCSKYHLEPVTVNKAGTRTKHENNSNGRELTISYFVPFTGSQKLLMYHPSTYTSGRVAGDIREGNIVIPIIKAASDGSESFDREFDRWFDDMKIWLDGANAQADKFNSSLSDKIKEKFEERAKKFRVDDDVMSGLRFPAK